MCLYAVITCTVLSRADSKTTVSHILGPGNSCKKPCAHTFLLGSHAADRDGQIPGAAVGLVFQLGTGGDREAGKSSGLLPLVVSPRAATVPQDTCVVWVNALCPSQSPVLRDVRSSVVPELLSLKAGRMPRSLPPDVLHDILPAVYCLPHFTRRQHCTSFAPKAHSSSASC